MNKGPGKFGNKRFRLNKILVLFWNARTGRVARCIVGSLKLECFLLSDPFQWTRSRTSVPREGGVPSRLWEAAGSVEAPGAPGLTAGKWRRRTTTCSNCCWSVTAASGRPACCSGSARTPSTPPSSPPSVSPRPQVHRRPRVCRLRLLAVLAAELTAADRESESVRGGTDVSFSSETGDLWPHGENQ